MSRKAVLPLVLSYTLKFCNGQSTFLNRMLKTWKILLYLLPQMIQNLEKIFCRRKEMERWFGHNRRIHLVNKKILLLYRAPTKHYNVYRS